MLIHWAKCMIEYSMQHLPVKTDNAANICEIDFIPILQAYGPFTKTINFNPRMDKLLHAM